MAGASSLHAAPPLLLPEPKKVAMSEGQVVLGPAAAIMVSDKSLEPLGEILAGDLEKIILIEGSECQQVNAYQLRAIAGLPPAPKGP